MNDEHITIYEHHNENPECKQIFTATVFDNRVLTTVTRKASVVRRWIWKIKHDHRRRRRRLVVGLGVQWCPPVANQVATLQLSVGHHCLVFQICHANSIPRVLKRFLSEAGPTFVGVRNWSDGALLMRDYNLTVDRIMELGSLANHSGASMETLASEVLGFHWITKPGWVGRSDWDDYWLSEEQVQYACVDAYISFEIGKKLKAWKWDC